MAFWRRSRWAVGRSRKRRPSLFAFCSLTPLRILPANTSRLTADFTFPFSREHPSNLPRRLLALSPLRFAEAEKPLFWNETARRLSVPAEAVIAACATKKGADRDQRRDRRSTYRNTFRQTCSQPSPHRQAGSYPRLATYAASIICISSQVIGNEYLRLLCGHLIVAFPGRISLACVRKRLTPLQVKTTEHPFRRVSKAVK